MPPRSKPEPRKPTPVDRPAKADPAAVESVDTKPTEDIHGG
jgi:hypothetical protein